MQHRLSSRCSSHHTTSNTYNNSPTRNLHIHQFMVVSKSINMQSLIRTCKDQVEVLVMEAQENVPLITHSRNSHRRFMQRSQHQDKSKPTEANGSGRKNQIKPRLSRPTARAARYLWATVIPQLGRRSSV